MTTPQDLQAKFWKALKSDRTIMLRLTGDEGGLSQPMTALFDPDNGDDRGPLYIFTAKDTDLVQSLMGSSPAQATFASKGHDLFAGVEGELSAIEDPALVDRLWSPFVAAWYEGGKTDPNLQLLRFDPGRAQIWESENGLFAGLRLMLGHDPKSDYQDKTAQVRLS